MNYFFRPSLGFIRSGGFVSSQVCLFTVKLNWLNKMHWLKWRKTTKIGFLRRFGGFVCSHENMSCKKSRRIIS